MLALLDSLLDGRLRHGRPGAPGARLARRGRATRPAARSSTSATPRRGALARLRPARPRKRPGAVDAQGNGSLMRILPLPLVLPRRRRRGARRAGHAGLAGHARQRRGPGRLRALRAHRPAPAGRRTRTAPRSLAGARRTLRRSLRSDGLPGSARPQPPAAAVAALDAFEAWTGRAGQGPRRGQLLVGLGRLRGGGRLPADRHPRPCATATTPTRRRPSPAGWPASTGASTASRPPGSAACATEPWPAGAGRPARRDRRLRVGRHAVADLAVATRCEWTSSTWRGTDLASRRRRRHDLPARQALRRLLQRAPLARPRHATPRACSEQGIDVLLLLVEDKELRRCRVTDIGEVLAAHGVELLRFPIVDPELPRDGAAYRRLIAGLARARPAGSERGHRLPRRPRPHGHDRRLPAARGGPGCRRCHRPGPRGAASTRSRCPHQRRYVERLATAARLRRPGRLIKRS